MFVACEGGHLGTAKWLFEVGAAADIHSQANYGWTPIIATCQYAHLDIALWLFEVGAAEDTQVTDGHFTPL